MAISNYVESMIDEKDWYITNLSNVAACLWEQLYDVSWVGFYLMADKDVQITSGSDMETQARVINAKAANTELVLGPFQGKVACIRIALGKGVCGTAAGNDETLVVPNVHEFPGHIACDCASNSEIVVPIHKDGKVVGVLDIDSPSLDRFSEEDKLGLEKFVKALETVVSFS